MGLVEVLQENLSRFRYHALALAAVAALALALLRLGPTFLTVVSFFWPLLLSTAFFLTAILVLRFISPPSAEAQSNPAGAGFMDYVASRSPMEEHRPEADGSSGEDGKEKQEEEATAAGVQEAAEETKKSQ